MLVFPRLAGFFCAVEKKVTAVVSFLVFALQACSGIPQIPCGRKDGRREGGKEYISVLLLLSFVHQRTARDGRWVLWRPFWG